MPVLHTEALSIAQAQRVLSKDLNLTFRAGEVWGILGANGVGKTTLLHTLAGLHPITQGQVYLQQRHLSDYSAKQRAQQIGLLFQDFNPTFPLTVWDYCAQARFPHGSYWQSLRSMDHALIHTALQQVELTSCQQRNILSLSGGEKRRLALAALWVQSPLIYLLDEPTNHLDLRFQYRVLQYLRSLAVQQSSLVLMTLHDVNLAQQFCDQLLLLFRDGSHLCGTPEALLHTENLTRLYDWPINHSFSPAILLTKNN